MRRFDEDGLLDRMAERGALTPELMAALGARIAALPRRPARRSATASAGPTTIAIRSRPTSARCASRASGSIRRRARRWPKRMPAALEPFIDLVARRVAAGAIRRCHGDLHLRNIVLIDGKPVPFDAIEFSETHRQHRRALRSLLRADGPVRARAAAARQPAAERMAVAHRRAAEAPHRRGAGAAADVPVAPRRRSAPSSMRRAPRWAARPATAARAPTSASRSTSCSPRRRACWRSAACRAAARPRLALQARAGDRPRARRRRGAQRRRAQAPGRRRAGGAHAGRQLHAGGLGQGLCRHAGARRARAAGRPQRRARRGVRPRGRARRGRGAGAPRSGCRSRASGSMCRRRWRRPASPRARPTPRTPRPPSSSASSATSWAASPGNVIVLPGS